MRLQYIDSVDFEVVNILRIGTGEVPPICATTHFRNYLLWRKLVELIFIENHKKGIDSPYMLW